MRIVRARANEWGIDPNRLIVTVFRGDDGLGVGSDDEARGLWRNVTGFENERVIVQRVQVEPGQWEGIHSHPGNQVFIHIKGGTWAGRTGGVQSATTSQRADGEIGWMDAIDISEEHESGNVGDTTIDLVWVTLK